MPDEQEITKGHYLINEGEEPGGMYFVIEGQFEATMKKGDGEIVIGKISKGELVGEMSFLDEEPRCASVRAISDSVVKVIPENRFKEFFNNQPSWYQALVKTLLERLRRANKRVKI
ncbi:MAG: cyclic nucleotide-binding domain-containing protein [Halobacteriovoraceae bacterium]|jgi:CRP/FNR family transcriptional regulator, cyclic AMP receptor protein|nr:cyclic nucleotide-binding domain-containing protein [Halobacteriovoraceae bacterium]MBT5095219.1 cyclic nucleotide-binding domain-containing protein [Halobacteriovoraceae bacterium]